MYRQSSLKQSPRPTAADDVAVINRIAFKEESIAMRLTMAFTGLVWGSSAPAEAVVLSTRTLD